MGLFLLGAALLWLPPACLLAETVELNPAAPGLVVQVLDSTPSAVRLRLSLGSFERDPVEIEGRAFSRVRLPGEPGILERGMPDLPRVCRSIVIPDDARMKLNVLSTDFIDLPDFPVAPSKGQIERTTTPADVPYVFDSFYEGDDWFPEGPALARDPYILRDTRGLTVVFQPFRYRAADRTLRVYREIVVELVADGRGVVNVLRDPRRDHVDPEFRRIYSDHFLNYAPDKYAAVDEAGEMLVIVSDAVRVELEPFVAWKNATGIRTTMVNVSEIGVDTTAIREYIRSFYDSTDLAYVLLVGDAPQVPTPIAYGGAADPKYALVAGDDAYPDLFVGRFSATNAWQARTQVRRSLEYERDATDTDVWFGAGCGIASESGPGDDGELDWEHMDVIRGRLLGFTYDSVDRIYDPGATADDVASALNEGRGIVNYCGHGSESGWGTGHFYVTQVNALLNTGRKLPVIHDVSCVNGNFTETTCFAENWVRASEGSLPTGAVAIYAASINQYFDPPMVAQDEAVDVLVDRTSRSFGGICYHGSCQMIDEFDAQGAKMLNGWILFGDPSLRVRTATPATLVVDHASIVDRAATDFEVVVPGVESALCGFSRDGAFLGSAYTAADGRAVIALPPGLAPGERLALTVTGPNAVAYRDTVDVVPHPVCAVAPETISLSMNAEETRTVTLTAANTGEAGSTLLFDVDVSGEAAKNITGSSMFANLAGFEAGATFDIEFAMTNLSPDAEKIKQASLDFPPGVTVLSSTDFVVVGDARHLVTNEATGEGVEIYWNSPTAWGEVNPGEIAVATVRVTVRPEFFDDLRLDWTLSGDGWGAPPHLAFGTIAIPPAGPALVLRAPNGGERWEIGEERAVLWATSGDAGDLTILCTRDDGTSWDTVAVGVPDVGSYLWTVPEPPSDQCAVKIQDASGAASDVSDDLFRIAAPITWVRVNPASGSLGAGEEAELEVEVVTAGLHVGDHVAYLLFANNGGDPVVVPVNVHVTSVVADPALSTVEMNDRLVVVPAGTGDELVVTVTLYESNGDPIEGVPPEYIDVHLAGVSSLGLGMRFCATGLPTATFQPEGPTGRDGRATVRVASIGGCGAITANVDVDGVPLAATATAHVTSPDLTGDGFLNYFDIFQYIFLLTAGTGTCGNYNRDPNEVVNFFDTSIFLQYLAGLPVCAP